MKTNDSPQFNYGDNKKQIFDTIISHIDSAVSNNHSQIFIKKLLIVDEEVDVIAKKTDWPDCLDKAIAFYKSSENYEACAKCQALLDKISSTKPKKTKSNGGKTI
jgi:hypothetical protein